MRSVILVSLFLINSALASGQVPNPPVASNNAAEQQLREMERLKDEAYTKGDKDAFSRIYADDYVATNAAGGTSNKQDLIKFNTGLGQVLYESHTSTDITVRAFTDFAIVTGTYTFKYRKPAHGDDSGQYRYTSVYVLRSSQWQIAADQFTRIKK
jgi:ketosteroid isomerase-like protein